MSLGTAAIAAVGGAVVGAAAVLLGLRMKAKAQEEPEKADPDKFTLLPPPNPDWTPGTKPTSPFGGEFETVHIADLRKNDVAPFEFFMTAMGPRMFHLCSTMHPDGTANLAPVCYLGPVSEDDPHIVMGVTRRKNDARPKDTQINVDATGEFVLNVVSSWCCEAAEYTAKRHAPDIDEFESSGFTKVASSSVKPFRCKETAIQLECKVVESVDLQDPDGAQASRVYIAKVRDSLIHTLCPGSRARGDGQTSSAPYTMRHTPRSTQHAARTTHCAPRVTRHVPCTTRHAPRTMSHTHAPPI